MKLLVADDVPALRWLLTEIMSRDGWQVTAVGDGWETLRIARRWQPHMVLLDLDLPGPGPSRVVAELQSLAPSPVVIVVTGMDRPEELLGDAAVHVAAVVKKPFDIHVLREQVKKLNPIPPEGRPPGRNLASGGGI
ncbi:MAG TPA: response regulator [Sphingobacteriaceae bacterium]|nr:response regulator [Sphingobacteriaceae bacterium]